MFSSTIYLHAVILLFLGFSSAYTKLSDESLKKIPGPGTDFDIKNGALLAPILRPRVSGTEGSTAVLNHFVNFFQQSLPNWKLEFQNSSSTTPVSNGQLVPFVNLIATRDPPWTNPGEVSRLTLVAHYDSKYKPDGFIGATDSAAPCAMLLQAARNLDVALTRKWDAMRAQGAGEDDLETEKGLQILFLDGEEAFVSWTDTDSLYGSRALAETWDQTYYPAMSTFRTFLSSISLFVLLDLLGSKDPHVPSYFKTTHWAYRNMADIEGRLRSLKMFKSSPNYPSKRSSQKMEKAAEPRFLPEADKPNNQFMPGFMVEDDHIPFMARGVEVLHVIPSPFPEVWHNMRGIPDDGEHLDLATVEDWTLLVTAFAGEWMELEGYMDAPSLQKKDIPTDDPSGEHRKRELETEKSEL